MNKKFLVAMSAYFTGKQKMLQNAVDGGKLTAEELEAVKAELAQIAEMLDGIDPETSEKTAEEIKAEIIEKLGASKAETFNECKEYVENAFRLLAIANDPNPTPKSAKKFAKLYENQINLLQKQLGVQVFENAITVSPSGSLPVPAAVAMAEPAVKLPKIFDYAEEDVSGILQGNMRGSKLRVIKVTETGNTEGAIGELVDKTITEVTMATTDITPLKVATVVESVSVEQIEFNDWLEATLKIYCTKLLFNNIEAACEGVLSANSTAYDGTSGASSCTTAFLENIAVAGAIQLSAAQYYGPKVAFVNEADWVANLNAQTTTAYPVENKKIAEHIEFIPSGAVPAGYMYVCDRRYIKKRMFKDVFVERAISHTHDASGNRIYNNGTDFIFDLLAFFFVEDAGAVVKLQNSVVKGVIE